MKKLVFNLLNLARNVFSGRWLSFTWRFFARCLRTPLITRLFSSFSSIAPFNYNNNNSEPNNSFVLTLDGLDAINFGFVFKKLQSVLSLEEKYLCSISIIPKINLNKNMYMFDTFESISIFFRFNSDSVRQLVDIITKGIKISDHSPEQVAVILRISVSSRDYLSGWRSYKVSPGRFSKEKKEEKRE